MKKEKIIRVFDYDKKIRIAQVTLEGQYTTMHAFVRDGKAIFAFTDKVSIGSYDAMQQAADERMDMLNSIDVDEVEVPGVYMQGMEANSKEAAYEEDGDNYDQLY